MEMRTVMRCIWPLLFGVACATEDFDPDQDLGDLEGIEEVEEGLTDLSGQCDFVLATGLMTLTLDSGNIALVNKRSDGKVVINGFECDGATSTTLKKIVVVQGTTGAQTLILDYLGGTFAPGISGAVGVDVDLGDNAGDALKIRGTKLADAYVFGSTGVTTNSDSFKDISVANVEIFVVTLSDGNDTFTGAGNATTGGAAFATAVTVYGGAGNDTLEGGAGDDTYFGGDGDDTFKAGTADDGSDIMHGDANTDTADYSLRTVALTVTLENTGNDGEGGATEADNVRDTVEAVKGGTANDTLTGNASANTLSGGSGDDTLVGGDGADVLNGDAGDDTFTEGATTNGADVFNGGTGTDLVSYAARGVGVTVTIDATANDGETGTPGEGDKVVTDVENVTGSTVDDTITGSTSANVLDGGAGTDILNGGDGNDSLKGSAGTDTLNGGNGDDTFDEGAATSGADTMAGGAGIDAVTYAARSNAITIVMDGITAGGEGAEGDLVGADVENLIGGGAADTITGNALDNQLEGGSGAAIIDTINGLGGDDVIDGGPAADVIDCGAGEGDLCLDSTTGTKLNCEL